MNKTIKIKRGLKANLPDAGVVAGEPSQGLNAPKWDGEKWIES